MKKVSLSHTAKHARLLTCMVACKKDRASKFLAALSQGCVSPDTSSFKEFSFRRPAALPGQAQQLRVHVKAFHCLESTLRLGKAIFTQPVVYNQCNWSLLCLRACGLRRSQTCNKI